MSQIEKPLAINADDPGLTAFALGELDAADAARYAEAVASSPELQAIVSEIQAEARILSDELRLEPTVTVPAERRAEIIAQATSPRPVVTPRQQRLLGISRRTAAVAAASVLLVPGAWYAFQTAFPPVQRTIAVSSTESARKNFNESRLHSVDATHPVNDSQSFAITRSVSDIADAEYGRPAPFPTAGSGGAVPLDNRFDDGSRPATASESGSSSRGRQPAKPSENAAEETFQLSDTQKPTAQKPDADGYVKDYAEGLRTDFDTPQGRTSASLSPNGKAESSKGAKLASRPDSTPDWSSLSTKRSKFLTSEAKPGSAPPTHAPSPTSPAKSPVAAASTSPTHPQLLAKLESPLVPVDGLAPHKGTSTAEVGKNPEGRTGQPRKSLEALGEKEVALAEIERIKLLPMRNLDRREIERLEWAQRQVRWHEDPTSNETYNPIFENGFITPEQQQLSTFSIDVDTASYANLRRFLMSGQLPPPDAVRIEELVNYFAYQYPQPEDGRPFSVQTDIAACPWQPGHQLVRIGLKGKEIPKEQRPPTNLVFLVDVSGSMAPENKLPLVRESLKTLVGQLDERDKIAIVTYAGQAGIALPSTSVAQRETIIAAINSLGAGGSTNGAAGINTAYDIAAQEFLEKGTNRVILCTDGDFNVGVTSDDALVQMIQTRAKGGVFLSIFGFGMGNLKDAKLEQLADKGNGQYGYIDDRQEADKVFIQEMMGTLVTIAKDVKIQIDFNKEAVASYRLVGYENRVMAAEDFHNDKKDAGEIGSGHTVTALYEIVPTKELKVDDKTRWLTVKLRYKQPEASESVLFEDPLTGPAGQLKLASSDFQFASSVAACGMLLRHSQHAGQANWALVKELAQAGLSHDPHGHRRGFLSLVSQAESLMGQLRPASPPAPDSTVRGKYKSLLRRLNVPEDSERYGQFNDYGFSETKSYGGSDNLPAGYWVYIAPHWYIWAETTQPDETKPQ